MAGPGGTGGATVGSGGAAGSSSGTAGGGGACTEGAACQASGIDGLCVSGTCALCTDVTDDAACASAYGSGHLCVGGACVVGNCHGPSDCTNQQCVDNQCAGCLADTDCAAGQVCVTGSCSDAIAACAGSSVGAVCNTDDLCCSVSGTLTCVTVACCTNAQCGANETCQTGACVPTTSGCIAPTNPTYYVDPLYTGPSTGSSACPFKTLHGAFNAVRNDSFTGDSDVIIKGGTIDAASEGGAKYFPMTIPSSVYVRTIGTATSDAIIIAPPDTTAFQAPYVAQSGTTSNWSARISHLTIKQGAPGSAGAALHISGGTLANPIHLDHLTIRNFFNGVSVDPGGKAVLDVGVDAENSAQAGLFVNGGRAEMTVGAAAGERSHYDNNQFGIVVTSDSSSVVDITGDEDPTTLLKTITASGNSGPGIRVASPNAGNVIRNVGVIGNGGNGVVLFAGAKVKLRHLRIKQNGSSGARVVLNGSVTEVGGLDLGTVADQGNNEFGGNPNADLCRVDVGLESVYAAGNVWETSDCRPASSTDVVPFHKTCAGAGAGVASEGDQLVPFIIANCSY